VASLTSWDLLLLLLLLLLPPLPLLLQQMAQQKQTQSWAQTQPPASAPLGAPC
jgi:hypothetical protein